MSAIVAPLTGNLPLAAPHGLDKSAEIPGISVGVPGANPLVGVPFGQVLTDALSSANAKGVEAMQAAHGFADGIRDDIHGTMIALKEADIELRLVSNVRTKVVDAFNDLLRMNI
jgi:flagellar hook-basal body complex protein FliE